MDKKAVILADGEFPVHPYPLQLLKEARILICCDGAAKKAIDNNLVPTYIIGDMDSLDEATKEQFSGIIIKSDCQETNDLTKAVKYAISLNCTHISIVGATGAREDHTLGNISLLHEYTSLAPISIKIYTNFGVFTPISKTTTILSEPGKQISIFALDPWVKIKSHGLRYPTDKVVFDSWWKATLNESIQTNVTLEFEKGRVLLFENY